MDSVPDDKDVLYLRVPPSLKRKLHVSAARKGQSITARAVTLLSDALRFDDLTEAAGIDPVEPIA